MFTKTLATVVALAVLGVAASSHAASPSAFDPDTISMRIKTGDLNLSSEAGDKAVLWRIHQAAKAICGDEPDNRILDGGKRYSACMSTITEQAVAFLGAPDVTASAQGSSHRDIVLASDRR